MMTMAKIMNRSLGMQTAPRHLNCMKTLGRATGQTQAGHETNADQTANNEDATNHTCTLADDYRGRAGFALIAPAAEYHTKLAETVSAWLVKWLVKVGRKN